MNNSDVTNINAPRDFMPNTFGDQKLSKETELNANMSIANSEPDQFTNRLFSLGGSANGND